MNEFIRKGQTMRFMFMTVLVCCCVACGGGGGSSSKKGSGSADPVYPKNQVTSITVIGTTDVSATVTGSSSIQPSVADTDSTDTGFVINMDVDDVDLPVDDGEHGQTLTFEVEVDDGTEAQSIEYVVGPVD